jgi:cytochrome d ubiquinol oxidase subunit I
MDAFPSIHMDALLLSRIQFGFVVSFHVMFPAFTVGLASWLAYLEYRWIRTADTVWRDLYFFWMKIFAVSFGMGVVSGIVMSFQFGTNWAVLSERAGNVLGPLLAYEVLTAFFLEASFLGIMLFGWRRISPSLHFLSTCLVAAGTLLSTFWILAANSWLHTPAGYVLVDSVFRVSDWWQVVFNPSFPYRLVHMTLAAYITTCFVIGGCSAWYLRRGVHHAAATRMLKAAVGFAAIAVPLQIVAGDLHGLNTLHHQPVKVAAMEAHWRDFHPGQGVPLVLFALPDEAGERNRAELAIPRLGSVVLTHSWDGTIAPLTSVPKAERPPVTPVFFAFRIMVGIGLTMLVLVVVSLWKWWRGTLLVSKPLLWAWNCMLPAGFVAILSGWIVTEMGRQPYVVYGVLRTADAMSDIGWISVAASLTVYAAAYAFVFGFGIWYLFKIVRRGPVAQEEAPHLQDGDETPARPMSAANDTLQETR